MQKINEIIEFISTKINDENLWLKFFNLSQEISCRYYAGSYKPGNSLEKFKKQRQDSAANDPTYDEYIIFENGNAAGWFDLSLWENELYFGFDVLYNEIPGNLLKEILYKLKELMDSKGFTESLYYTYREAIITSLKKTNVRVYEEFDISRLERVNMDETFYKSIVEDNALNKWRLEYYNDIPDSIIEHYTQRLNEYFSDMASINPYGIKVPVYTAESLKKIIKSLNSNGTEMGVYILFDDNGKIAGICWLCFDLYRTETLRHNGGMTAVTPEYRGKGIARFLKAKMYLKMLEENNDFRYITTDTMPWNKYMFKINEEFGFKPYRKGCSFKITKEFLENYLKLRQNY